MSKLPPQTFPIALITQDSIRKGEGIFLIFAHIASITSISCVRTITDISIGCQWMQLRLCYTQPSTVSIERALLALMRRHEEFIFHYTIIPPQILFVLPACAAISNIVRRHDYRHSRFNPSKMLIIAFPASVSTFPAGSSPITIPESFENALAIATRYCCPLLNSAGLWYLRTPCPTFASSSATFSNRASRSIPAKDRGSAHFLLTYGRD